MNSFLITFKPNTESPKRGWDMESMLRLVRRVQRSKRRPVIDPWRFSNTRSATAGDRAFLLVQGMLGPAIVGFGRLTAQRSRGSRRRWRGIAFEKLVDPENQTLATREDLFAIKGSAPCWRTQSSGILLPASIAEKLEALVVGMKPKPANALPLNIHASVVELLQASEGRLRLRSHFSRERNRRLVESKRNQAFLKYGQLICEVCGRDFASQYGVLGSSVIECHHTMPLAKLRRRRSTHIDDLALVCANCHRVLHKGGHTIESLRKFVGRNK